MAANASPQACVEVLKWYQDHGVDAVIGDVPVDRFNMPVIKPQAVMDNPQVDLKADVKDVPLGASDAKLQAIELAKTASTLDELKAAIQDFDGIGLKKTATNLVFADGNPSAKVMVIGEAPERDEDIQGKPFMGANGQLLDKIFGSIGLSRDAEKIEDAIYLSNIVNWRPPGNRTPSPGEIEASLPFIERHIQLVNPDIIILCGSIPAKALLGRTDSISRMRKTVHDYECLSAGLGGDSSPTKAIVTYHPSYLLQTPIQKKAVWDDMLRLKAMV